MTRLYVSTPTRSITYIKYEHYINKEDSLARKEFLKSGYGRKQLKEILKRTLKNILNPLPDLYLERKD